MTIWYESKSRIINCEMPAGASVGISETLDDIGKLAIKRSVAGAALRFQGMWRKAWKIQLSASGNGIRWSPAIDGLNLGDIVTIYCQTYKTARIAPGQASVVLSRWAVPGSIIAHSYSDDRRLPVSVSGRTVSIEPQSDVVTVKYRPALECMLASVSLKSTEIDGTQSWDMGFEETTAT